MNDRFLVVGAGGHGGIAVSILQLLNLGPIAIVDEDDSALSQRIATAFYAPQFTRPAMISMREVDPGLDAGRFIGEHANFHSGERFRFTVGHAEQLAQQFVARPTPARYLLLVESGDEVLDYRHAVDHYAGCRQIVLPGGDHSFTRFPEFIPQLLEFAEVHAGL